ncbi:MAG TPA: FAD-dependent oxidoreductase [Methylophilaceae bacterium]|nr:FAD-dependent oxidoreductase [Methylophilaceae bacterium]
MPTENTRPILIVGGGPVGATLALALQQNGIPVTVLEARDRGASHRDQRALALSYGSRLILERLGVWDILAARATAINTIHVSQRGSLGRARLKADDYRQPALGYVLSYGVLSEALDAALSRSALVQVVHNAKVTQVEPDETAAQIEYSYADGTTQRAIVQLAVLADGGNSLMRLPGVERRVKDYGHSALVARVTSEFPHGNIAYERFTSAGPVALLPNGAEFSLVWTGKDEEIAPLLQIPDDEFLEMLHEHFGDRVGKFLRVGPRLSFALRQATLEAEVIPHLAIIGNAAQTMHPVAGQGFNIGLRDAWQLADVISKCAPEAWGKSEMLRTYRKARQADTRGGLLFTDFLVNVFSNELAGLSAARSLGLGVLDLVKPFKQRLVSKMSFGR